jgi:hypothetical protein
MVRGDIHCDMNNSGARREAATTSPLRWSRGERDHLSPLAAEIATKEA